MAATKELLNNVRHHREAQLVSKAELARKAGLSPLTIDRVEGGKPCRMDTKRKIVLALGFKIGEREKVFPEGKAPEKAPERVPEKPAETPPSGTGSESSDE